MATVNMNFSSNSDKSREMSNRPPVEPLVSAASVAPVNKKPELISHLISPDVKNLGSYIVYDVLIPFAKNLFLQALDITLNGGLQNRGYGSGRYFSGNYYNSYTNYRGVSSYGRPSGNVYNQSSYNFNNVQKTQPVYNTQPVNSFTSSDIDYRQIALYDAIDENGVPINANEESAKVVSEFQRELAAGHIVTVADLYRACQITPDFVWENWGWDGDPNQISRAMLPGGGFRILVPDAKDIRGLL